MNILILGSGGREHAFAWKIKQSPKCEQLYIAPGNAGTASLGDNVAMDPLDFPGIAAFVRANQIGLIVVGPEEPLAKGIRDFFQQQDDLRNIPMVGPDSHGARLESSKDYAKQFMRKYQIPTAHHATFNLETMEEGLQYLSGHALPVVLKADGLAAGKGVLICQTLEQARNGLKEMLEQGKFGTAGSRVVIEDFLTGIELSVFVVADGKNYKILPSAKDYKRIGENDTGPNTGGMGAVSPVPFADGEFMKKVEERIIKPTIAGLREEGIDYRGFIFLGLINVGGEPMVIEYNARMGDPETQVVLPRLTCDLVDLLLHCATGRLSRFEISVDPRTVCTVVMVSGGYPGGYEKGFVIEGLDGAYASTIFHAGTTVKDQGIRTNGGRVLAITSFGKDLDQALQKSYATAKNIRWEGVTYREDIGRDLLVGSNNSS